MSATGPRMFGYDTVLIGKSDAHNMMLLPSMLRKATQDFLTMTDAFPWLQRVVLPAGVADPRPKQTIKIRMPEKSSP